MSRRNPETLNLAMDYTAVMEACNAYVAVSAPALRDPEATVRFMRPVIEAATSGNAHEGFFVLLLDTKNKPIGAPRLATLGLLAESAAHPRETFREAVRQGAASVILAHNHPSGDATPSRADIDVTRRMIEAGRILGIPIVDHLVIGHATESTPGFVSLREKNLVQFE